MTNGMMVRPRSAGCVVGLGLGRSVFVGRGVALLLSAWLPMSALGAPKGATVAAGQATIKERGPNTIIRASNGSIIDYSQFNIGKGETVRFIQPDAGSRVLNRVSGDTSVIDGTLRANGIVYVVNPAGVFFGKGAFVDVGQIYAGAGTITNQDFLNHQDRFRNVRGEVVNEGTIHADSAALIGQRVANSGVIAADGGVIAMVSGSDVVLQRRGDTMTVKVAPENLNSARSSGPAVENTGTLSARRGSALMAAGDMVSLAVRNTGTIKARNVKIEAQGRGTAEVSGRIDASNQAVGADGGRRGGNVEITGQNVRVAGASIDASGERGGGSVSIGGGVHGAGPVRTATTTSVDSASVVRADATEQGSGGTIAVWSNSQTSFKGTASAAGGAHGISGGDGGFIETSGKETVDFAGAHVTAQGTAGGRAGTWLIDPGTITIDGTNVGAINTALNNNTNAVVDTASGVAGPQDININAAITKTAPGSGATLTLTAGNNVNITQPITAAAGQFNVTISAGGAVTLSPSANIATGGGAFQSGSTGTFTSGAGATIATDSGAVGITASDVVLGALISNTGAAAITLAPGAGVTAVRLNNGAGNFNVNQTELGLLSPGSGGVIIGAPTIPVGIGSSGGITGAYSLSLSGSTITFNNTVTLGADQTLTLNATNLVDAHAGADAIVSGTSGTLAANIATNWSLGTDVARLTVASPGASASVTEVDGIDLGGITAGSLSVTAGGAITDSAATTVTGAVSLTTTAGGAITLDQLAAGGAISLTTSGAPGTGDATIVNAGSTTLGTVNIVGALGATAAGGGLSTSGTITTAGGNVGLTATGIVTVGAAVNTGGGTSSLTLTGSDVAINGAVTTGSGGIALAPSTLGAHIGVVDTTDGLATFLISASDLANLTTTGLVTIGRTGGTGTISVGGDAPVNLAAGDYDLTFRGGMLDLNGPVTLHNDRTFTALTAGVGGSNAATDLTIGGNGALVIDSTGAVDIDSAVARLAVRSSAGSVQVDNTGATLAVTSLGGVTGVSTAGGATITLSNTGTMAIGVPVTTTGIANITAGGNIAVAGASPVITASTLNISSTAGSISDGVGGSAETAVSSILSANGQTGVAINNTGAITASLTSGAGAVRLINAGSVTQGGADWTGQGIDVEAMGPPSTLSITQNVTSTGGAGVTLVARSGLSVAAGKTVSSGGMPISIAAGDLSLGAGSHVDAGAGAITITATGGTIAIGDVSSSMAGMKLDNAELAAIKAATLTLGDGATTAIGVKDVTAAGTMDIGTLALRALGTAGAIDITGTTSIFQALDARATNVISAADGVILRTTRAMGDLRLDAAGTGIVGAGDLTLDSAGPLQVNGASAIVKNLTLTALGAISVNGVVSAQTTTMTGNNGVLLGGNLTTTMGPLSINADADNDGTGTLTLNAGVIVTSTNQNVAIRGADLDLMGGSRIDAGTAAITVQQNKAAAVWLGDVSGAGAGDLKLTQDEMLVFKARTLTIGNTNATVVNVDGVNLPPTNSISDQLWLVGDDISIAGAGINTGAAGLGLQRANAGTIGVGNATGSMTITGAELGRIIAPNLTIGGGGTTDITVDGVAAANVAGIVGPVNLIAPRALTFSGATSIFKDIFGRGGTGITLGANLSATTGDVSLTTDTGAIAAPGAITLRAGRNVTLARALTTGGATVLRADTNGDGVGTLSTQGIETASHTLTISAAGLTLGGTTRSGSAATTIDRSSAGTIQVGDFTHTTDSATVMTITGAELQAISAMNFTLGGANTTALNARSITQAQSDNLLGTTRLLAQGASGDINLSGTGNTFRNLSATAVDALTSSAALSGRGFINLSGADISTAAVTVAAALSMNAGSAIFASGALMAGNAIDLTAGSNIRTDSTVHSTGGHVVFDAGAGVGHQVRINESVTAADTRSVEFKSPVVVTGTDVLVHGRNISFDSTLDGSGFTPGGIITQTVNNGTTTFTGAIGSKQLVDSLSTTSDGMTLLGGDIRADQRINLNNPVTLRADVTIESVRNSIIISRAVDSDTTARSLTVLAGSAELLGAAPASPMVTDTVHSIWFGDRVGSTRALRNLFLNYRATGTPINGHPGVPPVATIVARPLNNQTGAVTADPGAFHASFTVTQAFRMGQNEKLTSAGTLLIKAGTAAIIGDLNALGDLTVMAPTIDVLLRAPARLYAPIATNTAPIDTGVDYVSGGSLVFTTAPTLVGTGPAPEFRTPEGQRNGVSAVTLATYIFRQFGPVTFDEINLPSDFQNGTGSALTLRTLDLRANGSSSTDPSTTLAKAIPRETRQNQVSQDTTISQASRDELSRNFNIYARDPRGGELLSIVLGGALYDDVPKGLRPTPPDFTTVTTRLPGAAVEALVGDYLRLFFAPKLGPDGQPITDPVTGKPAVASQAGKINKALTESVNRFAKGKGGQINPGAYRAYLEATPEEAEALGYIRSLGAILTQLESVGLTPRELRQARTAMFTNVKPARLKADVFEAILRNPRVPAGV